MLEIKGDLKGVTQRVQRHYHYGVRSQKTILIMVLGTSFHNSSIYGPSGSCRTLTYGEPPEGHSLIRGGECVDSLPKAPQRPNEEAHLRSTEGAAVVHGQFCKFRIPFGVLFIKGAVLYYIWDLKIDPNLENYSYGLELGFGVYAGLCRLLAPSNEGTSNGNPMLHNKCFSGTYRQPWASKLMGGHNRKDGCAGDRGLEGGGGYVVAVRLRSGTRSPKHILGDSSGLYTVLLEAFISSRASMILRGVSHFQTATELPPCHHATAVSVCSDPETLTLEFQISGAGHSKSTHSLDALTR